MKTLFKRERLLSIFFIISFLIVSLYYITDDMPEIIIYGDFIFNLFSQLSLAYMGSFIFFVVQVYKPRLEDESRLKKCVADPINRIILDAESPFLHFMRVRNGNINKKDIISDNEIINICNTINPMDKAPLHYTDGSDANYNDYFYYIYKNVDKNCSRVMMYVGIMDTELISIINEISSSSIHELIEDAHQLQLVVNFSNSSEQMITYYKSIQKLKKYSTNHGIELIS